MFNVIRTSVAGAALVLLSASSLRVCAQPDTINSAVTAAPLAAKQETLNTQVDQSAVLEPPKTGFLTAQPGILNTEVDKSTLLELAKTAPLPGRIEKTNLNINVDSPALGSESSEGNSVEKQVAEINLRRIIPIILDNDVNSKTMRIGDNIHAKLKENLYYGLVLIAPAGSIVDGRIIAMRKTRTLAQASFKNENRFNTNAALDIVFDAIHPLGKNMIILMTGRPAHQSSAQCTSPGVAYGLATDRKGRLVQAGRTLTPDQQNVANGLRVATISPLPGGLITNLGGTPIIMATVGAISPDIAFNRPVDASTPHRRLKGMGYGFVTSLPGAFFVQSVVEKGSEIVLAKGQELMLDITVNNQVIKANTIKTSPSLTGNKQLSEEQIPLESRSLAPLKPDLEEHKELNRLEIKMPTVRAQSAPPPG